LHAAANKIMLCAKHGYTGRIVIYAAISSMRFKARRASAATPGSTVI
jgi:hypothetical protein